MQAQWRCLVEASVKAAVSFKAAVGAVLPSTAVRASLCCDSAAAAFNGDGDLRLGVILRASHLQELPRCWGGGDDEVRAGGRLGHEAPQGGGRPHRCQPAGCAPTRLSASRRASGAQQLMGIRAQAGGFSVALTCRGWPAWGRGLLPALPPPPASRAPAATLSLDNSSRCLTNLESPRRTAGLSASLIGSGSSRGGRAGAARAVSHPRRPHTEQGQAQEDSLNSA